MTNLERNRVSPFPGIMNLGTGKEPVYVAASSIISIGYITPQEIDESRELGAMAKMVGATTGQGCITFSILDNPNSLLLPADSREAQRFYAQIWSMERIRR